jgi:hypothetical protein
MRDAVGVANYFAPTGSVADGTRRGTASVRGNSYTSSPKAEADQTRSAIASGDAAGRTAATAETIIPVRNSRLSADETKTFLAKLRRGRDAGYLPTLPDFDLLLEIAEESTRGER